MSRSDALDPGGGATAAANAPREVEPGPAPPVGAATDPRPASTRRGAVGADFSDARTSGTKDPSRPPQTVAIAGATGYIGTALRRALSAHHRVVGLSRSETAARSGDDGPSVEWRRCDLFRLQEVEEALRGVDCAIYLVHSMLPSARLTQSSFADLDLLLADNFARAAARQGVKQILYVGGLIPEEEESDLSPHLASRLEVERALASYGVPVTALRAGLVVGPRGSSLSILVNLVRRLPAMVLPRWTESRTQPIALVDLVRAVDDCVGNPRAIGRTFDVGGPDVLTYREMLARTAGGLGKRCVMFGVPLFSPRLSRLWVTVFSGAPQALVSPLIESLRHEMLVRSNELQDWLVQEALGFDEALRLSLDAEARASDGEPAPRRVDRAVLRRARTVRSIQRMPLPAGRRAPWVAQEYVRFLPRFVWPLLRCEVDAQGSCRIFFSRAPLCLMELRSAPERSSVDRQDFHVTGGFLTSRRPGPEGRLEFREVLGGRFVLAAVQDFRPALPWFLYQFSQARVHLWVMRGFRRHLARAPAARPNPAGTVEASSS